MKRWWYLQTEEQGFTLLELLIVLICVAILVALFAWFLA